MTLILRRDKIIIQGVRTEREFRPNKELSWKRLLSPRPA